MSITAKTKLTENQTNKVLNINSGMSLLHTLALVQTGIVFNKEILEGYKSMVDFDTRERNNTIKAISNLKAKEKALIKAIKEEQKK